MGFLIKNKGPENFYRGYTSDQKVVDHAQVSLKRATDHGAALTPATAAKLAKVGALITKDTVPAADMATAQQLLQEVRNELSGAMTPWSPDRSAMDVAYHSPPKDSDLHETITDVDALLQHARSEPKSEAAIRAEIAHDKANDKKTDVEANVIAHIFADRILR